MFEIGMEKVIAPHKIVNVYGVAVEKWSFRVILVSERLRLHSAEPQHILRRSVDVEMSDL